MIALIDSEQAPVCGSHLGASTFKFNIDIAENRHRVSGGDQLPSGFIRRSNAWMTVAIRCCQRIHAEQHVPLLLSGHRFDAPLQCAGNRYFGAAPKPVQKKNPF
jgi:hypothetical protein